jgi:hypothetical protein
MPMMAISRAAAQNKRARYPLLSFPRVSPFSSRHHFTKKAPTKRGKRGKTGFGGGGHDKTIALRQLFTANTFKHE